jgi:hypothetical protein
MPIDALAGAAALAVLSIAQFGFRQNYRNICDDALISLRYAQQWVAGNGLVFNTGERVEGYTNFLWTVVLGGTTWLSQQLGTDPIQAASLASSLFAAGAVVLVAAIGRQLFPDSLLPIAVALGVCAVDNAYGTWAFQGLEGPFVAFWALLSLWIAQGQGPRRGGALGLSLAALWMTRPDAGLFVVLLLGFEAVDVWRRRQRGDADEAARARALVTASALCIAIYSTYFAWRFSYYGYLLPNTFYVKVGGELNAWTRGWDYAWSFVADRWGLPLLAFGAVLRFDLLAVRVLGAWVLLHGLYIVSVGGDFYAGHRFFVPLIPALALLLGVSTERLARLLRDRRFEGVAGAAALFVLVMWAGTTLRHGPLEWDVLRFRDHLQRSRAFMTWLGQNSPPEASVLVDEIGAAGVFANRHTLDFHGILDPEVAHQDASLGAGKAGHEKRASMELILRRRPDYVKFGLLLVDFWQHGYYLDTSMPPELAVPGIWRLDTLEAEGRYLGDAWLTDDSESLAGWERSGDAFEAHPTRRAAHGPNYLVMGQHGGYASSYSDTRGAQAQGRLLSPLMTLSGERLVFRVGGGNDPERLRVCLWVEGERVECTTGFESIALARRTWDIRAHRGKTARIELVDASDAPNGILLLDEVRQWVPEPGPTPAATTHLPPLDPRMPPGRWQRAHAPADALARAAAQLEAIGYVAGSEPPAAQSGTTRFDRARTQPGINFSVSGHAPEATLRDLEGEVLHRWRFTFDAAWPEREVAPYQDYWRRALPLPNGDLLAIWDGLGLVKLDRDSKLLWKSDVPAHHALELLPSGEIVVLTREAHAIPRIAAGPLFLEDYVSVLGPGGEERARISLLEALEQGEGFAALLESLRVHPRTDLLHANSIQVLGGEFADRAPWLRRGNVLTSFREPHMLAVLDPQAARIVKAWTGDFRFQHDPRVLPSGTLLLFDNGTAQTGSRIVERDLVTDEEIWSYRAEPPLSFFSEFCGTAQRLPNGNTLVTESTRGRAFELTRDGEIVWEWHSPHRAGEDDEFVASLLEVMRLPETFGAGWRRPPQGGGS